MIDDTPPFSEFNNPEETKIEQYAIPPLSKVSILMKSGSLIDFVYWEKPTDFFRTWNSSSKKIYFVTSEENILEINKKEVAAVTVKDMQG